MYTVNMYYCYCILHHAPLYHSCHSPPVFPNFCHLSPFSCSISLSSCSAFPTCCTILSVSSHFSQFLSPFPLYRSFSEFDLLPFFYLFLPPFSQFLVLFPSSHSPFPSSFPFTLFFCPISSTFIYFPLSSLICPAHVLSFMQAMPPFLCSYLLCPLPIPITPSSQFLPSISFSQFPSPSIQFQLVSCYFSLCT